jgi:hypothetical protein
VLDFDIIGLDLGFQVAPLSQRKVLEDPTVGVAGDDAGDRDTFDVVDFLFVEPIS